MRPSGPSQHVRVTAGLIGLGSFVWSALLAQAAWAHMAALGEICGGAAPHCDACYGAIAAALTAVAALAVALRPQARAIRIRSRD